MTDQKPQIVQDEVEYAGFRYYIAFIGDAPVAMPVPGQHSAAHKDKHRRAAVEQWRREQNNVAR